MVAAAEAATSGAVGEVVSVVPVATALRNAVMRTEPGTGDLVVVDPGEVAADAPGDAARGAAATVVGIGTSGTPAVALFACAGASVGACG